MTLLFAWIEGTSIEKKRGCQLTAARKMLRGLPLVVKDAHDSWCKEACKTRNAINYPLRDAIRNKFKGQHDCIFLNFSMLVYAYQTHLQAAFFTGSSVLGEEVWHFLTTTYSEGWSTTSHLTMTWTSFQCGFSTCFLTLTPNLESYANIVHMERERKWSHYGTYAGCTL